MNLFKKIFLAVSVIYLLAELFHNETVLFLLKPMLMLILILWVYNENKFENLKTLFFALSFSLIGDTILLFSFKGEVYFIFGLIAFLLAQFSYSLLFLYDRKKTRLIELIKVIPFILLSILLLLLLEDKLGGLLIPVCIYASVITLMGSAATLRNSNKNSYLTVLYGALLFISSDSLLAINKFYMPIPQAGFLIMFTYITAQYLIADGILKNNKLNFNTET